MRRGVKHAAGMYMVVTKRDVKFLADTTVNIDPDAETLAETAILAADIVNELGIEPRIAMLSFSNFGDAPHPQSLKVSRATALVKERRPDLTIDGEMQANVALDEEARAPYPFTTLKGPANVLIFPESRRGQRSLQAARGGRRRRGDRTYRTRNGEARERAPAERQGRLHRPHDRHYRDARHPHRTAPA